MNFTNDQVGLLLTSYGQSDDAGKTILVESLTNIIEIAAKRIAENVPADKIDTAAELIAAMVELKRDYRRVFDILHEHADGEKGQRAKELFAAVAEKRYVDFARYLASLNPAAVRDEDRKLLEQLCNSNERFSDILEAIVYTRDPHRLLMKIAKESACSYGDFERMIFDLRFDKKREPYIAILAEMAAKDHGLYKRLRTWNDRDGFNRREIIRRILNDADAIAARTEHAGNVRRMHGGNDVGRPEEVMATAVRDAARELGRGRPSAPHSGRATTSLGDLLRAAKAKPAKTR